MLKKYVKLYNEISTRIEIESDNYVSHLLSHLVEESTEREDDTWFTHEIAMLTLRSYRVSLACKLFEEKGIYDVGNLRNDMEALLKSVESIEYKGQIDDAVVADAVDCVCAFGISVEQKDIVIQCLPQKYQGFRANNSELTMELYNLLIDMADYCFAHLDEAIGINILLEVISLSKQRNGELSQKHREIVVTLLAGLGDYYPEVSHDICKSEENNFQSYIDEYTGDFLWYYGCALQRKGEEFAYKIYDECYIVRRELYGKDNWYTVLARREYIILSLWKEPDLVNEKLRFIEGFINKIEEGGFPEVKEEILEIIEGKTIYVLLLFCTDKNNFLDLFHYIEIYEHICKRYNELPGESLLKSRLAENFYGIYYMKTGDYIQAEKSFINALNAFFPEGTDETLSINQIKSNLLMIYYIQNDMERAFPLLVDLLETIENGEEGLFPKDEYRVYVLYVSILSQAMVDLEVEDIEVVKKQLDEVQCDIESNEIVTFDYARELSVFVFASVLLLAQNSQINNAEYRIYLRMVLKIRDIAEKIGLDNGQKVVMYLVLSILEWEIDEQLAEIYIEDSVALLEKAVIPLSTKATVLETAASLLCKKGKTDIAFNYLDKSLRQVTEIWHSYIRYFNDARLLQILVPTQLLFSNCYAVMRQHMEVDELYEKVLQYKALASLAGKERNRILNSGKVDKDFCAKIKAIQDRMARLEADNIFLDTSEEYERETENLRQMEAQISHQFPNIIDFTEITINRVKKEIPNNSVIIEYFMSTSQYAEHQNADDTDVLVFDVFISKKIKNECSILKMTIPHAESIIDRVDDLVNIFQDESCQSATVSQMERKEELRMFLYKDLLEPITDLIKGVGRVFIAPDSSIMNLPFDILCNEMGERFGDIFEVVKMECARDFLFGVTEEVSEGSLIVGNPKFEIDMKEMKFDKDCRETSRMRFVIPKEDEIKQLPFSELEVKFVSKYCCADFFVDRNANKKLIFEGTHCRNIHLATHGYYDLSEETDTIYSSCLLFAGAVNWLRTGYNDSVYGNGIVTADEISRLNFKNVELVVLSSCLSGMNETVLAKGLQGLVGGFAAAGVTYVVSNLWLTDDFATAVLMDAFYYQYKIKELEPPTALRKAKEYLRKVTIGELKERHWFEYILHNNSISSDIKEIVNVYLEKSDKFRPFKREIYWAGFTCFKCN
ncbi:MAG: CHAT domain-containing protein [Lachnospiraceae bacterium]|nr:CHAT domain-containing protein [Lachnospiraceae bacterium]